MGKKKPAKRKKATQAAKRSNPELRSFYRLGQQACKVKEENRKPPRGKLRFSVIDHIEEATGESRNEVQKAWSFARRYTKEDLEWLCSLGSKKGTPLTRCHVHRLVTVEDDQLRRDLAERTSNEEWTVDRLSVEIRLANERPTKSGRRPERFPTVLDAMLGVEKLVKRLSVLKSTLQEPDDDDDAAGVALKDLPRSIKSPLKGIFTELNGLQEVLDHRIKEKLDSRSKEATRKRKRSRKK